MPRVKVAQNGMCLVVAVSGSQASAFKLFIEPQIKKLQVSRLGGSSFANDHGRASRQPCCIELRIITR